MQWGQWELTLRPDTPAQIIDLLNDSWYSLVSIYGSTIRPELVGTVLPMYTGTLLDRPDRWTIGGTGPDRYLGEVGGINEDDQLGPLTTNVIEFDGTTDGSLTQWLTAIVNDTVCGLSLVYVGGPSSATKRPGRFLRTTAKTMMDWTCGKFGVEYIVGSNFWLLVGTIDELYPFTEPYPMAIRRGGRDLNVDGINASRLSLDMSVRDRVQRCISVVHDPQTHSVANAPSWPFKNPQGDTMAWTWQQSGPELGQATTPLATDDAADDAVAQVNKLQPTTKTIKIESDEYDVTSRVRPGEYIMVYDVEEGLFDQTNKISYRGRVTYPVKLRTEEITWPVQRGMAIMHDNRHQGGGVTDLTRYVDFDAEGRGTSITVGKPPTTLGRTISRRRR